MVGNCITVTASDGTNTGTAIYTGDITVDKTVPTVTGVIEDGIYNISKTITFNEGIATLNGGAFTSGSQAVDEQTYTLVVTDAAGNSTTTHFTIDKSAPTVNVPTSTSTQNTSITVQANATDTTTMQYLFNKDGGDQGTWQTENTYNFTGLAANTAYAIKYMAKDAVGNTSGYSAVLNVTTTAVPGPLVGAVTMMELRDLTNNDNASDIRVLFRGATNESNIASYKIIVAKGTIDEATASGLTATSYMALPKKRQLKIISNMPSNST